MIEKRAKAGVKKNTKKVGLPFFLFPFFLFAFFPFLVFLKYHSHFTSMDILW